MHKKPLTLLWMFLICFMILVPSAYADTVIFNINGIKGAALTHIEAKLNILETSYPAPLSEKDIQAIYQKTPADIKEALQPYGYFKATLFSQLTHQKNKWTIHCQVIPGPLLRITSVDFKLTGPGQFAPAFQKLQRHFPLQPGQAFLVEDYNKTKALLFEIANHSGYLKAELIQKEIQIDLQHDTVKIILHFDTGMRYYFGEVSFNKTAFSPDFLKRFIEFKPGEPFSSDTLLTFQQDLDNSRYFQQVIVTPETNQIVDYRVPVTLFATLPKSEQYHVGVGYGTFTGPRATIGVELRRMTDTGHHLKTQLQLSSVLKGLAAKYFIPGKNPLTDQYTLGADIQRFIPKNGKSTSEKLSAAYVKTIRYWQSDVALNYLVDHYDIIDEPSETSELLFPSFFVSRVHADNVIFPRHGSALSLNIQGSNKQIVSSTSFIQGDLKGKYIVSPTEFSRVIVRGELGYTVVNDLLRLPLTLRFFAGGLGSVRGYPYSSIGPGRYLEVASVEYQHHVVGNWHAAVFYDVGTASNHFNDTFSRGNGIGVIYNSVIGPIQLYVARAESTHGKPLRVEFSIGPDF